MWQPLNAGTTAQQLVGTWKPAPNTAARTRASLSADSRLASPLACRLSSAARTAPGSADGCSTTEARPPAVATRASSAGGQRAGAPEWQATSSRWKCRRVVPGKSSDSTAHALASTLQGSGAADWRERVSRAEGSRRRRRRAAAPPSQQLRPPGPPPAASGASHGLRAAGGRRGRPAQRSWWRARTSRRCGSCCRPCLQLCCSAAGRGRRP